MTDLPDPRRMAPVKAVRSDTALDNWLIAYQTGNADDGADWCIVTDNVRASVLFGLDFPADARDDAEAIAAILNAYREGRLVLRDSIIADTLAAALV